MATLSVRCSLLPPVSSIFLILQAVLTILPQKVKYRKVNLLLFWVTGIQACPEKKAARRTLDSPPPKIFNTPPPPPHPALPPKKLLLPRLENISKTSRVRSGEECPIPKKLFFVTKVWLVFFKNFSIKKRFF